MVKKEFSKIRDEVLESKARVKLIIDEWDRIERKEKLLWQKLSFLL